MIFSTKEILEISLIGLGLLIALYTIIMDRLDDIKNKKIAKTEKLEEKYTNILEKLSNQKDNKALRTELTNLDRKIDNILYSNHYHYEWGYIFSTIFLIGAIIFSFVSSLDKFPYHEGSLFIANLFLWIGILNFCLIWILTIRDMRTIFRAKIDTALNYKTDSKKDSNI